MQTIQDVRDAIVIGEGAIGVAPATLGSADVSWLLAEYFPNDTLTIRTPTIVSTPADDFVLVRGIVQVIGVDIDATVKFYVADGMAQIDLQGSLPAGWRFANSFASLRSSYFNDFVLNDAALRLTSQVDASAARGLRLSATFQLPPVLDALKWFADPGTAATLSGPISLDSGEPVMLLSVAPCIHVSLGGYLDVNMRMEHLCQTYPNPGDPTKPVVSTVSRLAGDIAFEHGGKDVDIPLAAYFNEDLSVLNLRLSTDQVSDIGLAEIAHWFNGLDLAGQGMPDFYRPLSGLTLRDVNFAIGLRTQTLEYVTLSLQSTDPWALVQDKVTIDQIAIDFMVIAPATSAKILATITGKLRLGNIALDVSAQVPDFQIRGALADDSEIELTPLIEHLVGANQGLPETLSINALRFEAHPSGGFYSFEIDLTGEWQFISGLALTQVAADIAYFRNNDGSDASASFRGLLRIAETDVAVSGTRDDEATGWQFDGSIGTGQDIALGALIADLARTFGVAIDLPSIIENLAISDLGVSFHTQSMNLNLTGALGKDPNPWVLDLGPKSLKVSNVVLAMNVDRTENGSGSSISGLISGTIAIGTSVLELRYDLSGDSEIHASGTKVNLTAIIDALLGDIDFPKEIPDIVFDTVDLSISPAAKEFSLSAVSTDDWAIPLGVAGLLIEDLCFSVQRKAGSKKNTFVTSGSLSGAAQIGSVATSLEYKFPGDFVFKTSLPEIDISPVIQDLCGAQAMMGLSIPTSVSSLKLRDIEVMAAPKRNEFSISGSSPLGKSELIVTKNRQGKWIFMAAFAPPSNWKFSSLDGSLKPLDNLSLDKTALVLSSAPDRGVPLSVIEIPADIAVGSGLTFFASLDLSELGVKDLMNVEVLTVSTSIDRNPANIKLAASMGGSFQISKNVAMGDMNFFLKPAPSNFELGISGSVLAKLDASDLTFVGMMGIRPIERSAAFSATMLGFWKEPFGIQGLAMGDIAMEVGIGIVPPPAVAAPIVGIAGSITVGSVTGNAAVKFDTANPGKSMIAASFNRLSLREVIQTFCDAQVYKQIPREIRNTVLAAGLEDVGVYVVPQPTTIGELAYDAGFRFEGKLSLGDFDAQFFFLLSYSEGFAVKASMDPIRLGDAFTLEGSGELPGPTLDIDLRIGGKPGIVIAGLAEILGLRAETLVSISDKGFLFLMEGKIFNLFVAGLTVSGGNLKSGGDFYVKAEMRNDLVSYLREHAQKAIQDSAKAATKEIEKAQKNVDDAQRAVDGLQRDIDAMRKTVQAERDRDAKKVKDAEKAVDSAQAEVNKIQRDIDKMRNTIQAERDRDTKRLQDAQKSVADAQGKVNSIQGEINSSKKRIDTLNGDIKAKKKWYNKSPWYKQSYRWAEYSAYAASKGAEITALYTKIGGMETAKATANGVLEGAKQVVRGIEKGAKVFPIDADPRMAGLFTAKGSATVALEGAKQTLKLLQTTIKSFPIDADPRIAGLFTAKGGATGGLQSAKVILDGARAAVGGLASVGNFVAKYGLGGLLDVMEARFEGQLNVVKGGSVNMALKLKLMNEPKDLSLVFSFTDPLASVKDLADKLIKEIT